MTSTDFEVAVIGAGPIGSATARHLALEVDSVGLIGPDEPETFHDHDGPWSGWYDEGRMFHTLDLPLLSGLVGARARRRFEALQQQTGITFAAHVPALTVALDPSLATAATNAPDPSRGSLPVPDEYFNIRGMMTRAEDLNVSVEYLEESALKAAYPLLKFPTDYVALHSPNGLLVNPRKLVSAEIAAAVAAGATRVVDDVVDIQRQSGHYRLVTRSGSSHTARRVVLAAGAYINLSGLSPKPLDFWTFGATVSLAAVDAAIPTFPTLMYYKTTAQAPFAGIIAPPLPYPDGQTYIKGAGDSLLEAPLQDAEAVQKWVRTGGDSRDIDKFAKVLSELLPNVQVQNIKIRPCLVTINTSTYPYIGFVDDNMVVATEGDHGVTMADEIGRLAARLSTDGEWRDDLPAEPFAPKFA